MTQFLQYVLGKFSVLFEFFTGIFSLHSDGRCFFSWGADEAHWLLVMNKCVAGELCSRSLLSAPLSCCLLPCCPFQAFTSPPPIRQPFKLRLVLGWWRVAGSGLSDSQPTVAALRRSCSLQTVLILCFWLGFCGRCCVEDRVEGCSWLECHNQ